MAADREILFGLLALQNGLVGRDDLVTAFQIWMKDKTQTLAQILQQRTSGLPAEFELLQRLVELHITKHGQDPQQSLASLSSLDSVINELQQLGNADIEATFMQIGQDQRSQPRVAADVDPGKKTFVSGIRDATRFGTSPQKSRFRILRPHARGGLGEVFVAQDEELNRDVALKEIRSQFADDKESRSRFVVEAEITGGLEHPGIVPVYGLGQYENGRPYLRYAFYPWRQSEGCRRRIS
jgi:hypothetical protein